MFRRKKEQKENDTNNSIIRLFILFFLILIVGTILIYRVFTLQIVKGSQYEENFRLMIDRTRSIKSTRGNIYDCNGALLAYNELAYNITIEDVYESGSSKNPSMNKTILNLIHLIEQNDDTIINDFNIYLDEDDQYCFSVSGTALNRFLADIYGHKSISDLKPDQKNATPDEVIAYLGAKTKFGVGDYAVPGDKKSFLVGLGYSKKELLQIITIRYALSLNNFQKYIATTVASDVNEKTVAVVMENSYDLKGVSISSDTVRRYNDSVYLSQIIGYTGKISSSEYETFSALDETYTTNDIVGKSGIEQYMETTLQGKKGNEHIYVDNLGRIIDSSDLIEPVPGNDVYLTIDKELQIAVYNILEQKIAGILVAKIQNVKEYRPKENATSADIIIPISDVYNALFQNNIIDLKHLSGDFCSETETEVYETYKVKSQAVIDSLRAEMTEGNTPYKDLDDELQVYESYIVSLLSSSSKGILVKDLIDTSDETYLKWTKEETISLKEYLSYAIARNWIDVTGLELKSKYADSEEIYSSLVDYIIEQLHNNTDFSKKIYKYMIRDNEITGKQICMLLWDQDIISVEESTINVLREGKISPYQFMLDRISNLDITPAQLALDPCSGSCVITDCNNGNVLALVSYPSYDNNKLANSADTAYLARLNSDLSKPLWNYATQQRSAPGSTFKMVSAVAGIMENVITLRDQITCTGYFDKLSGKIHKCWIAPRSHGSLDVTGAIQNSCNCFFYEVGYELACDSDGYHDELGIQTLYKYADMFGLSEKSGVEIAESEPQVSTKLPVPSAIGQGDHDYSTVGLARYLTTVANSGTCYDLTLIDKTVNSSDASITEYDAKVRNTIILNDSVWDAIHLGMRRVVEGKKYFTDLGVNVAGKTGTAQESTLRANHALFVGYAPYEKPEIAFAVRVANGYSSDYAAQITKDIMMYYFELADEEEIITGTADEVDAPVSIGD